MREPYQHGFKKDGLHRTQPVISLLGGSGRNMGEFDGLGAIAERFLVR